MPTSSALQYVPTSPPQDARDVPRYLDDELNRVALAINQLNSRVLNAVPWKGFYALILGGTTTTNFSGSLYYNVTPASPVRQSVGVYRFTLQFPTVQTIQVIDKCFPSLYPQILGPNQPQDTEVFFAKMAVVDAATGVFDISLFGGNVPTSGKLTLIPYDLKNGDKLYVSGDFSIETDASVVALNLGVLGEF